MVAMAKAKHHSFLTQFLVYAIVLHLSFLPIITATFIHDLLSSQGLPAGLFPKDAVKKYDLDEEGHLQVFLDKPSMAKFETRFFFDTVVRANLTYGGLIGLEGLSLEELFLWLPVKDIVVYDPCSGLIVVDLGLAKKLMPLYLFEDPPACNPQGVAEEKTEEEAIHYER